MLARVTSITLRRVFHVLIVVISQLAVLTGYVLFVTNFAAIGLDKFAEYVVSTSKSPESVTTRHKS